ncbi:MAG: phosphodiesterase [Propionibacteriaceae bacterium]|nr:phosphodiesterase [Propionibacteriaceae bacterium]
MNSLALPADLRRDIDACGYFPDLIAETIALATAGEPVLHHVVHHEATFARDEIQRHLSVLVLTPTRLIVGHTDESDAPGEAGQAMSTTESVGLNRISSVALTRVVAHPERHGRGRSADTETWLSVGWGTATRVELEPAHCGDPECDADHGYSGTIAADDLTVRMSVAADGPDNVARLVSFATALQLASGGGR